MTNFKLRVNPTFICVSRRHKTVALIVWLPYLPTGESTQFIKEMSRNRFPFKIPKKGTMTSSLQTLGFRSCFAASCLLPSNLSSRIRLSPHTHLKTFHQSLYKTYCVNQKLYFLVLRDFLLLLKAYISWLADQSIQLKKTAHSCL